MITKELETKTLELKAVDKIHLVEMILESLDKVNPEIENAWVKETEARVYQYELGNLKTIPFEKVMQNIKRK